MTQEAYRIDDEAFILMIYAENSVRVAGLASCESLQIPRRVHKRYTFHVRSYLSKSVYGKSRTQ